MHSRKRFLFCRRRSNFAHAIWKYWSPTTSVGFRPCLLYPIKQCTAPCAAKIGEETYREDINRLVRFLDGDKKRVLAGLDRDMIDAAKTQNFERAGRLRDEIKALHALSARGAKGDQAMWQPEAFVHNPQEGVAALQEALGMTEPPRILGNH